jgi:hypothetical protein
MSVQKNTSIEMRKHVRQDVPGVVCVTDRQAKRKIGRLVNISEEGLMILTDEPVAENAVFQLHLEFCNQEGESDPIEIGVESLWCKQGSNENQFWAGFYIIDISEQNQDRIRSMIG